MSRFGISRNVLVACAVLFTAELCRGTVAMTAIARVMEHPDGDLGSWWSMPLGSVLAIAPLLLVARLSNYLRPSSFLTAAAGLALVSALGGLLPSSFLSIGLLSTVAGFALSLAAVASLLVIAQDGHAPKGALLGGWCAMVPLADAVLIAASSYTPPDMWRPLICGVLVLTLGAFLASILGPPIEPVSTFEQFDLPGAALWLIGISGVIYLVATRVSSGSALAAGIVGLLAFGGLVIWIRQQRGTGFVPPGLVSRRGLAIGLIGALVLGVAVALSGMESVSLDWPAGDGAPTNAPVAFMWLAAAVFALTTGRLLDRGAGVVVPVCGVLETVAGVVIVNMLAKPADLAKTHALPLDDVGSVWTLAPGLVLFGAGVGTLTVWLLYMAFRGVPRSMLAPAAGLMATALLSSEVLGGFVADMASGDAAGLRDIAPASAVSIVVVILGLGALIVVPMLTKRWAAQQAEEERETDPH